MRVLFVLSLIVGLPAYVFGDSWKHELLFGGLELLIASPYRTYVNRDGVPAYTASVGNGIQAFRYRTSLNAQYLGASSLGQAMGINDEGQVAYTALDRQGRQHMMVDGHDYYADLYTPTQDPSLSLDAQGVDSLGRPLWSRAINGDLTRVHLGVEEVSQARRIFSPYLTGVSPGGIASWSAFLTEGGATVRDGYASSTNLSKPLLGDKREVVFRMPVNRNGDILWAGQGSKTDGKMHLFLTSQDLTPSLGQSRVVIPEGLSDNGRTLWSWRDENQKDHLMRDAVDLTEQVFGQGAYTIYQQSNFISPSGVVGWLATPSGDYDKIFYETTDISSALLGVNSAALPHGFDDRDGLLWTGRGRLTGNKTHVYYNQFDISLDALGAGAFSDARGLTIGASGHILWYAYVNGQGLSLFLSTPVPEPAPALLGFSVLVLSGWRPTWRRLHSPSPRIRRRATSHVRCGSRT